MANNMVEKSKRYMVAERELLCPLCNCDMFNKKNIKINNTIAGFLGIEENVRSLTGYICNECNHLISFVDK